MDETWRHRASCRGPENNTLFCDAVNPENPSQVDAPMVEYLRAAFCRPCPVRGECLEEAVASRERYAVWGGATPSEIRWLGRHGGCEGCGCELDLVDLLETRVPWCASCAEEAA